MDKKTEINRNRPSEKGSDSDPNLRDETAAQPGISTISSTGNDDENKSLTETASDNFKENNFGEGADKSFDEKSDEDY